MYVRNGVTRKTSLTPEREESDFGPVGRAGISSGLEPLIGRVEPGSPAAAAGLRPGDRIVSAERRAGARRSRIREGLRRQKTKPIAGRRSAAASRSALTLAPTTTTKLGVLARHRPADGAAQALPDPRAALQRRRELEDAEVAMSALSPPLPPRRQHEGAQRPDQHRPHLRRDVQPRLASDVIGLMAMISLQLGVMNLLPIPVLDGGHIMILLIEGVARRDLSLRVKERIQQVASPRWRR